ncbi:hypothetical protein UB48_10460 [Pseudomonas sp. 2(2015)]|nr:hypothetical protein UB48_10460 [Pseudomonas sp. 2(2015)]
MDIQLDVAGADEESPALLASLPSMLPWTGQLPLWQRLGLPTGVSTDDVARVTCHLHKDV